MSLAHHHRRHLPIERDTGDPRQQMTGSRPKQPEHFGREIDEVGSALTVATVTVDHEPPGRPIANPPGAVLALGD